MKRVLHISKYYFPFTGGIEQTARDCVNSLAEDYEQKVICFNEEKKDAMDIVDGVEVIRAGTIAKIASQSISLSYGNLLKKIIDSFQPDIIVFHYPNPFVAHYLLKHTNGSIKLVLYWHLDIVKQKLLGKFFVKQNFRLIERSNVIIATSPIYIEGSKYLSTAKNKCKIVPSCIDEERLQISPIVKDLAQDIREKSNGKIICLAVGRHTEYKGFNYLIRATHLLDERFIVYITGKGEETENLIQEAGKDSKIVFLGLVSDDMLKAYLLACDIFCFPSISKNEAFGLALAEAMYFEKPAVTFNIPGSGVNYVCLNGENGLEVENRDIEAYAEAMRELADNPEMRRKMGAAGKQRVENMLLKQQYVKNIRTLFKEL